MRLLVEAVGRLSVFLGKSCGVFYAAAITLSLFEVFMRYAVGAPTSWTSETIMTLVATAWLLSGAAVTQQRRHITITTLGILVGDKMWRRMQKLAVSISIAAVLGLTITLWGPMIKVIQAPQTSGSAFDPPSPTYIKVAFVIAAGLYLLQLIANLCALFGAAELPDQKGVSDGN